MRSRTLIGLVALAALLAAGIGFSGASFTAASGNPGNDFSTADSFGALAATMNDPGAFLAATVTLTASATDGEEDGSTIADVTIQRSPADAGTWTDVCTDATSPYSCSFDTTAVSDGLYDFRAVVVDTGGATATSNVVQDRRVDNAPPSVSLDDPSGPVTSTKTFSATASDGGSGVASVTFQVSPAGAGTWSDMCSDTTAPYACGYDTSLLGDGSYDFRARASDVAGNAASSAAWTAVTVDNTAAAATAGDPGANLRLTVALTASADDGAGSGVASVTIQRSPADAGTWTNVCTDTTAPYSCDFDTTAVADGLYDFRAVAVDGVGLSAASAAVEDRRIDNAPPSASMTDPGTNLLGTVTLEGDGADTGSGVASVTIQRSPAGADTWSDICTDASSPYSCSFDTTAVADGLYDIRAVAFDNAGNGASSAVYANRRIDNAVPSVSLDDPGSPLTGVKTFSGTASDGGSGVASVIFQVSPAGAGTWSDICSDTAEAYACDYDTSLLADGSYDFRAVALDAAGNAGISTAWAGVAVDNGFPSVSLTDPGAYLRATVTLSATASDTGSGVASVTIQRSPAGADTWTDVCTDTTSPYSCSFDTTAVGDGLYDFRALATDNVARTTVSATVGSRRVDNTLPSVTMSDPGAYLRATVTLSASASDTGSGVASVTIQRSPAGAGTWTDVCIDTASPYSCSFDTTAVVDGLYDLRAVAADNAGNTAASTVAARQVDNTPPSGSDVEAVDGGGNAGRIQTGDAVTFTYSEALLASSVLAGWNGSSLAVTVRVTDNGAGDRLSVYDNADTTLAALTSAASGGVNLGGNYVPASGAIFDATMVQSGATITVTLGSLRSGGVNNPPVNGATMSWTPSGAATDPAGNVCQTTAVAESTGADKDF